MRLNIHMYFVYIIVCIVFLSGCTTNLLWEGGSDKYIEVEKIQTATIDNIYLDKKIEGVCIPYTISQAENGDSEENDFPQIASGYYVTGYANEFVEQRRIFRTYKKNRMFKTVFYGPLDLDFVSVDVKLSRLTKVHWSDFHHFIQGYPYLWLDKDRNKTRAWERKQKLRRKYKYYLSLDIALIVPEENIVILNVNSLSGIDEITLNPDDIALISDYFLFVKPEIKDILKQSYDKDIRYVAISPVGWVDSENQIVGSGDSKHHKRYIGILMIVDNKHYFKILFNHPNDLLASDHFETDGSNKVIHSITTIQPRYKPDDFVKQCDFSRYDNMLPQNRDFNLSLEFIHEQEKREKLSLPLRILLTPFSLIADAAALILAPIAYHIIPVPA